MLGVLNQSMVPLLRAMDHVVGNKTPDNNSLKTYISDAVKIISGEVNKINQQRREAIKKEVFPRFKSLCTDDQPISASGLFGDNLADKSKNLDASKSVQMTPKGSNKKNFLFKRGGERQSDQRPQNRFPPSHPQSTSHSHWKQPVTKYRNSEKSFGNFKKRIFSRPKVMHSYSIQGIY